MKDNLTDIEQLYKQVLKNCIECLEKLNEFEVSKLPIIMKLGSEIDNLVSSQDDKEPLLKRLSRDISKSRKKMIDYETLETYHQLYLDYDSPENLKQEANELSCDVSVEMLSGMMKEGARNNKRGKGSTSENDAICILDKIKKLLIKVEIMFEDNPLDEDKKGEIENKFDNIRDKFDVLEKLIRISSGSRQQKLFTANDKTEKGVLLT
jgi:hypothetical protein